MSDHYFAYIGTNSVRGSKGIYSISIDGETCVPKIVSTVQKYNTGSVDLTLDDKYLYAAAEGMTFQGYADGGVTAFRTNKDGSLEEIGAERSFGQRTCCVAADRKAENLYVCNFYDGTFSAYDLDENGVPSPARYTIPAPEIPGTMKALHCIKPIGESYVGVISLTEGALIVYEAATGKRIFTYVFPGRPFCRYLEVTDSCVYALMQDPGDVYVFRNLLDSRQELELIQKISIQDEDYKAHFGATTIRATPDQKMIIAATREANSLTVFRVQDGGLLERSDIVTLPGLVPRDFAISHDGRITVTALQKSNEVCVHRIDYDNAKLNYQEGCKISVPSPAAVAVSGRYRCES